MHPDRLPILNAKLAPHWAAEQYFEQSGRTFRKSRFRLWFNRNIKPKILIAVFRLFRVYDKGRANALTPQLTTLTLAFPDLPAGLEGFEILQVSDLHIDRMDGLAEALRPLLSSVTPDVCVLTGDFRWEITGPCDAIYPRLDYLLSAIHPPCGTFGILGNHDACEIAVHLEQKDVRMLINEAVELEHRGARICIAGTDDPFDYRCADLEATLGAAAPGSWTVLLTHTPELYDQASRRGVRLYLCGHTHGGQVRLPWIGAVKKNAPVPRKFVQGHWTHEGMQGYTSYGAGCSTLPVRLNCPPEVTLIRLTRAGV